MCVAHTAVANDTPDSTFASAEDLAAAEYISETVECTVIEVATQYESGSHEAKFQCIENSDVSGQTDGMVFELAGLPSDFKRTYRRKLNSINAQLEGRLPALNLRGDKSLSRDAKMLKRKAEKLRRIAKSKVRAKLRTSRIYRSQEKIILTNDSLWSVTEDTAAIDAAAAQAVEAAGAAEAADAGGAAETGDIAETISVSDESTVLVLHITALDSQTSASPSQLSDSVFGTYGDPVNLVSQYRACSYGQKTFVPAEGPYIVDGVAQISIGINARGASSNTVINAVTSAANALLGSLAQNYDHVMYAIPPGTADSWIAFGYFNYFLTVYNDNWATTVSSQMHEIGHNFYLNHSSEGGNSYADQQGMMGYSYNQDDGPVMCFNAAKNSQLGWYSDKELAISQSWTGKVIGLADYDKASPEQNVILKIPSKNGKFLFLTYNRKVGINSGTQEAGDKVTVVEGADRETSNLLAKLGSNGTYTIPNFWSSGNELVITVDEIGTDYNNVQYAMVSIENGNQIPTYTLTVNAGSGGGNYQGGAVVNIAANGAPSGKVFDRWIVNAGAAIIANASAASTTVIMPASAATITASYKDLPVATFALTVNAGSGGGNYQTGAVVNITADAAPSGKVFDRWIINAGAAVIANASAASTTLIMGSNTTRVTATYTTLVVDEPPTTLEIKIQELYVGILGRGADSSGLAYWVDQISKGTFTLEDTRAAFTDPAQTEYTEIYGGLNNFQLVEATYENFLERAPDQAGLVYWVGELDAGRVNPDQMINAIINAVKDPNATGEIAARDMATLANKIEAAIYFTEKTVEYTFDAVYREMARAVVANVTDAADTLAQAKAMTDEYVGD